MKSFLRSALLGAATLTFSVLIGGTCYAGAACVDACSSDCRSQNLGCKGVCGLCLDDTWCQPGGTCGSDGMCMNVACGDAGIPDSGAPRNDGGLTDAGDAATSTLTDGSVATDTGVTPIVDAGPTPVADAGPIDTGPRLSSTPEIRDEVYDAGCECTATSVGGPAPWTAFALLGGLLLKRRRRATAS